MYKLQARATREIPLGSVCVIYGTTWENCEGTDTLTQEECRDLVRLWMKDDRLFAREHGYTWRRPHQYRIVEM